VFFDIGAHVGFYTLLAASCVGKSGKVVAFEPAPRNLHFLRQHVAINRLTNVQIVAAAVADRSGPARLQLGPNSYTNFLSNQAGNDGVEIETVALDDLMRQGQITKPDCIKLDIEGAEELAIQGASQLLREARPLVFIATHSDSLKRSCHIELERLGYRVENLTGPGLVAGVEFIAVPL